VKCTVYYLSVYSHSSSRDARDYAGVTVVLYSWILMLIQLLYFTLCIIMMKQL